MYQFIIILDEIKGIRYSQNELNNGNLTAIQLVNYLRISHLQKNFHTLATESYTKIAPKPSWITHKRFAHLLIEYMPICNSETDQIPYNRIRSQYHKRCNPFSYHKSNTPLLQYTLAFPLLW